MIHVDNCDCANDTCEDHKKGGLQAVAAVAIWKNYTKGYPVKPQTERVNLTEIPYRNNSKMFDFHLEPGIWVIKIDGNRSNFDHYTEIELPSRVNETGADVKLACRTTLEWELVNLNDNSSEPASVFC